MPLFPDISQCSVATNLRCGGIFDSDFIANLIVNLSVKVFLINRLTFGDVMGKGIVGLSCVLPQT